MVSEPDAWVAFDVTTPEHGTIRKILAGWYGGYAGSDSWKMNSGVEKTEEFEHHFDFHGYSGSIYRCYKSEQRMSGLMSAIYSTLEGKIQRLGDGHSIEIVEL